MSKTITADMTGKIAIVTGATAGIGKEIARGLAVMGATVVIGARSAERGEAARAEIVASTQNPNVEVLLVDVAEPASVRAFVERFRARHDRLDVLVNNAGVWFTDRRQNSQGHELTFSTNVVGPWLLTSLLEEPLRAAAPSRVVNVVSGLADHYDGGDLLYTRRKYDGFKVYAQSKAAERMITWGLADRLAQAGVTVNAAAPGFVKTDFNREAKGFMAGMIDLMARLFADSPEKGAATPLWAATSPDLDGVTGRYFDAKKEKERRFDDPTQIAHVERACAELAS